MKAISLDLRERILAVYDAGQSTRDEVAKRFRVSLGMVKKLLCQRKRTGQIGPQYHRCGRKPKLVDSHRKSLRALIAANAQVSLADMREALALKCSLPAIHYVLAEMGLTYKKRHCEPANRSDRTSAGRASAGNEHKESLIRHDWSSSTRRRPKRI